MKSHEEIIWRYLDVAATPEDRKWVEKQLLEDASFRQLFVQCQLLQQNLQEMEADVPSLRFSQNVMDRLPPVGDLATAPLISGRWIRALSGALMGLLTVIYGGGFLLSPQIAGREQATDAIIDRVNSIFKYLPESMLFFAGMVIISLGMLLLLDRWLQNRFLRS